MPAKQPQDHKKKAEDSTVYSFTHNGKTYDLPSAAAGVEHISGQFLRDAIMDGTEGQMRLGFAMLEAIPEVDRAREVLYSLPAPQMLAHVEAWMDASRVGGASLGESSGSSV